MSLESKNLLQLLCYRPMPACMNEILLNLIVNLAILINALKIVMVLEMW